MIHRGIMSYFFLLVVPLCVRNSVIWQISIMTENEQMEVSAAWQDFRRRVRRRRIQRTVVYSLLSVALFLIPAGVWLSVRHDVSENVVLMAEGVDVVLCDGTKVSLAAGSRLYYPERFEEGIRRVRLEGNAYFDVESSPENPFVIDAAGGYVNGHTAQQLRNMNVNIYDIEYHNVIILSRCGCKGCPYRRGGSYIGIDYRDRGEVC